MPPIIVREWRTAMLALVTINSNGTKRQIIVRDAVTPHIGDEVRGGAVLASIPLIEEFSAWEPIPLCVGCRASFDENTAPAKKHKLMIRNTAEMIAELQKIMATDEIVWIRRTAPQVKEVVDPKTPIAARGFAGKRGRL